MKLLRYKVSNFRSVRDSGWISCDDVTTLVGINEAGKSNLLLALWKLNPASGGNIDITHDMPVSKLSELRNEQEDTAFITAEFEISEATKETISEEVCCLASDLSTVEITRYYNGEYKVDLPKRPKSTKKVRQKITLEEGSQSTEPQYNEIDVEYETKDLENAILKYMPKFVYYSNYGNLNTRLYLPHVITWLNGGAVSGIEKNEDQVRTLRVLFEFVKLDPKEILELGRDTSPNTHSKESVSTLEKGKEERSILLQSAGTDLTRKFKEWWKQGEYKFRFEADGDFFSIWVSDYKRPEEVSLELRSTGLQWFLSFYLVFLVESQNKHKNAILLLDEAGLTLHPTAQRDLCKFFNGLSKNNQIIHTTHSPFIVDTNNIDRCKVVYVDNDGFTVASDNLRISDDKLNEHSIYAVHAALGLSVSDILFQGCKPVIVEGTSDQIYLNTIKQVLISMKKISPKEEIIFVPSGGVKGISGIVSILGAKANKLPFVIVDSDNSGQEAYKKLTSSNGLYKDQKDSVIEIKNITGKDGTEIEDLIPYTYLSKGISKLFSSLDEDTVDEFENDVNKPILPQIEQYAHDNNVELPHGWKVELAKTTKAKILKQCTDKNADEIKTWVKLFEKFLKN